MSELTAAAQMESAVTRRKLLLGLASASAAAIAAPGAAEPAVLENPELIRLGDLLHTVASDYKAASEARENIAREWGARWPLAPETLLYRRSWDRYAHECTIDGNPLVRNGEKDPFCVMSVEHIVSEIKHAERLLRGKTFDRQKKVRGFTRDDWEKALEEDYERVSAAREYEAECTRVRSQSGIEQAKARHDEARAAFTAVVKQILAEPEYSMAGVVIKAQAISVASSADAWMLFSTFESEDWGTCLARSVLHYAEARA
ncbi:hypothetical protein GOL41_17395 [Sinorhizobium medicae]|nr:hypothetical protein [Sinorhizobium medicae]MDX0965350.1 hypothetical protein [Sinorhizobium medicae]MDX1039483.1 hypothetical protein [Sinorhizobium medicae]MDX1051543.1 hypothetical protein [Sinorhizobium medicae]